ncbi:MAG: pyridoxal phosphate-dependent aminotransferase [Chloroflexi bacterium]|nr:pyridoxal phosphate-dependent aminotransferase [Chloroflexota bacterium]
MDYRRMPIEIESPEEVGYDRIRCNLAESSVADARLGDLDLALADLVLLYGDHLGHAGLREIIASDGPGLCPTDVLLTPGAAAALFMVATSLLRAGDHLIVARPNYATNLETPRAIGADISFLDLGWDDAWAVDPARIGGLLRPETRLVSLTTPHNPTGQVLDDASLAAIVGLVEAHPRAHLLVDETYRELQDGQLTPLAASRSERVISVSSLSKAYGLPGIRVGWLVTRDSTLCQTLLAAKEQIVITGSIVDETIGYEAVRQRDAFLGPIRQRSAQALAMTRAWMATQDVFEWHEPRGGVVGFVRVRPGIDLDMDTFYARLFEGFATIVGPGHWFEQSDRSFRLGFGWPTLDRLEEGLAALSAAAAEQLG